MSKSKPESKIKPAKKGTRISSIDALAKANKGSGVELSDDELKKISGGALETFIYLKS